MTAWIIARHTLLEAWRTRLFWLAPAAVLALLGLSAFVAELALTEGARVRVLTFAALARPGMVLLLALAVLNAQARELNERGLELLLSLDLRRADYVLGKALGYGLAGLVLATVAGLGAWLAGAGPASALAWSTALACELILVAAFSLFCAVSLGQLTASAAAVAGFYVLARAAAELRLLSHSAAAGDPLRTALGWLADGLALLLPRLDLYARTDWLLDPAAAPLAWVLLQTVIYLAVLLAATLHDFYRKSF